MMSHDLCTMLVAAVLLQAACSAPQQAPPSPTDVSQPVPSLAIGMTLAEVHDAVGASAHEFTVARADQTARCVWAPISTERWWFYLVFVDDRLVKIVEPPKPRIEIVIEDGLRVGRKIVNVDEDVEFVLQAPGLSPQEAAEIAAREVERNRQARERYSEPLPIPRFLWELGKARREPDRQREKERRRELMKQFDPMKVQPGMSPDEVALAFGGDSVSVRHRGEAVIRLYGSAEEVSTLRDPWVAVKFEGGVVTAVYSMHFFDPQWLVPG